MSTTVRRCLVAWLLLVAVTVLSWYLGGGSADRLGPLTASVVLVFAFAKTWVVGREFMELRSAPRPLRRAFDAWVVLFALLCGSLAFL
ncbi:cytochrome C oxidase subunit IV family protein [Pseudonocardia pini]|uniref:cytochrome C oxidase subunit IV family protein n=1 Tax=Pseudonocardia pini TaxID=2758030 RepID=UPI0015F055BD|nr:cytochrome C oxidase subunit IV family protein [Pseudonocardia pini]